MLKRIVFCKCRNGERDIETRRLAHASSVHKRPGGGFVWPSIQVAPKTLTGIITEAMKDIIKEAAEATNWGMQLKGDESNARRCRLAYNGAPHPRAAGRRLAGGSRWGWGRRASMVSSGSLNARFLKTAFCPKLLPMRICTK